MLLIAYFIHGQRRVADADEFQALTNAADAARGLVPYQDFWDNHGPLNIWLLQPILSIWNTGHSVMQWIRGLMWLNLVAVAAMAWFLVRKLYPQRPIAAMFTTIFLLSTPPFLSKGLEIRGDNPANFLATAALVFICLGLGKRKALPFLMAGLAVGVIAGFTLKFVIIGASLVVLSAAWHVKNRRMIRLRDGAAFGLGVLVPIAILGIILYTTGLYESFRLCYFGANSSRGFHGFSSSELTEIVKKSQLWGGLAIAIILLSVWRVFRLRADAIETGLTLMVVFLLGQYMLFLPTKNLQSLLPGFVPLALLAGPLVDRGITVWNAARWSRRGINIVAGVGIVAALFGGLWRYCNFSNKELPKQIHFADKVLAETRDEAFIFDPSGVIFLKAKPGAFHVLVTFVRDMHRFGVIDLGLVKLLDTGKIDSVIFDKRTDQLRAEDIDYLHQHYYPAMKGANSLLLRRYTSTTAPAPVAGLEGKELDMWNTMVGDETTRDSSGDATWFYRYMDLYRMNHP